jgi:uncharacterized protein YecE (DUF72 family)
MDLWIGTSGYSYMEWVGPFYPPGTSSSRMLRTYARFFPTVELNFTFYRVPTPDNLLRLADQTPPGFPFVVKLHQSMSHEQVMTSAGPFREALDALDGRGRLAGILCQFPQRFHHNRAGLDWLEALRKQFRHHSLSVEFRHASWAQPEVTAWLAERAMNIVSVDVPPAPGLFPTGLVLSGRTAYVRFHSRNQSSWYDAHEERYNYDYSDDELREWVEALAERSGDVDRAFVYFNNCRLGHAAANALRFRELLAARSPALQVIGPLPAKPSRQRDLFDGLS